MALGIVAALLLTRFLSGLLFGVGPTDPLTFGGVALVVTGVVALACARPAFRASRLDPQAALRVVA
jgi:ABC-type antimicrobial peptide transport system permease subunit